MLVPALSPDHLVRHWEGIPRSDGSSASFSLAEVHLSVESDDALLLEELRSTLGRGQAGAAGARASLSASVRTRGGPDGLGHLRLHAEARHLLGPEDLLLGLLSPEFPFQQVDSGDPAWIALGFRGEAAPVLAFRGEHCLFRQVPRWRTAVALLLYHRLLRLRPDALFFHAASVGVRGQGVLFIGPKGAGKSTIALALAARGHNFLGDETACYVPATGDIIPFRRPVGIKPGVRAKAVEAALSRAAHHPDGEGIVRMDIDSLLPVDAPAVVPLRRLVFMAGFAPQPRLERIEPGREELALLQPIASCLVGASYRQRVFEMARMLARAWVYRLSPGDPDETADILEGALAA